MRYCSVRMVCSDVEWQFRHVLLRLGKLGSVKAVKVMLGAAC